VRVRFGLLAVGLIAMLLLGGLPVSSVSQAGDIVSSPFEPEGLKGLKGVYVLIEDLNKDAVADGLSKQAIQTDVERKLQQSGIRVLTEAQMQATPGKPALCVRVSTAKIFSYPTYSCFLSVELKESVKLQRNFGIQVVGATTWQTNGVVGYVFTQSLFTLRDHVKDEIDQFCNAWLTANPKK
jgi:hypothetical protein